MQQLSYLVLLPTYIKVQDIFCYEQENILSYSYSTLVLTEIPFFQSDYHV